MSPAAIVLYSGGKDSTVALWWARRTFREVTALSFCYPSRPKAEQLTANAICREASIPQIEVELPFLKTLRDLREETHVYGRADAYVPARNLVFYAAATFYADAYQCSTLVGGHLRSDGNAYSDATPEFFLELQQLLRTGLRGSFAGAASGPALTIELPLISLSDQQAVALGRSLGAPLEHTWSCWEDAARPCEQCKACQDRQSAMGAVQAQAVHRKSVEGG
jgi:7-cyano-7-deazaguanine synthase